MKIECFSKRKLNVRKIYIFADLHQFNFNLQQDLETVAFWENPEKFWSNFSKNQQVKIQQNSGKFCNIL